MNPFGRIPLAWLQLTREKTRLMIALMGVGFATILMFMQIGFHDALFDNAATVQHTMKCDLVVISRTSEALFRMQQFSRRNLYRLSSHPQVVAVSPLKVDTATWKNPESGRRRAIFMLGIDPRNPILSLPGLDENLDQLNRTDVVFFDERSRLEFGAVKDWLRSGRTVTTELNLRRVEVKNLVSLGASFAADGNVVVSDANFQRIQPNRPTGSIDVGMIKLAAGADLVAVQRELQAMLPPDLVVLTMHQFEEREKDYWREATAIGFVFNMGVAMGFVVGFVIVYQILYTDVANHLPQYATLKAMGYTDFYLLQVVLTESLMLSMMGFLPGLAISAWLYHLTQKATMLPMYIHPGRLFMILGLTVLMCGLSGFLAVRKLRQADPADVF